MSNKQIFIKVLITIFIIGLIWFIWSYDPKEKVDYDRVNDSLNARIVLYENMIKENSLFVDSVIKMKLYTDSIVLEREQEIIKLKKSYEKKRTWVSNASVDSVYLFITEYLSEYYEREY
jgi:hypothetical protein